MSSPHPKKHKLSVENGLKRGSTGDLRLAIRLSGPDKMSTNIGNAAYHQGKRP
jgi:hypothetical protein